jgi:hypothetical protein
VPSSGLSMNYYNEKSAPDPYYVTPTTSYYRPATSYQIIAPVYKPSSSAPPAIAKKNKGSINSTTTKSLGTTRDSICHYWSNRFVPGPLGVQHQPLYWATERQDVGYQRKRKPFWTAVRDYVREMFSPNGNKGVIRVRQD